MPIVVSSFWPIFCVEGKEGNRNEEYQNRKDEILTANDG